MRRILIWLACLFSVVPAYAQTPPQLTWNAPADAQTAIEATGLNYTLYVNGGATGIAVTGVNCTGTAPFPCSAPVPTGVPSAIGTKLELTAKAAAGGDETARSVPFISPPQNAPTNLRRK